MLLDVAFTDMKLNFSHKKRSNQKSYMLITKVIVDHDRNKIKELTECLKERMHYVMPLHDCLIIFLPVVTWIIARSIIMLYTMMKSQKGFVNIPEIMV